MPTNNHNYPTEVKGLLEVASIQRGCSDAVGASCLCFFGFLRMGEVMVLSDKQYDPDIHLSYLELRVNDRSHLQWLEVHIKASKMVPFRQDVSIYVGTTRRPLCPVANLSAFLVQCEAGNGTLFLFKNGWHLTRTQFVAALRSALQELGIASKWYSGHSFRSGAAKVEFQCEIQDSLIEMLGCWWSSSYLFSVYLDSTSHSNISI